MEHQKLLSRPSAHFANRVFCISGLLFLHLLYNYFQFVEALFPESAIAKCQSLTVFIASGLSVHTLSRPRFVLITIRARTRVAMCFEIICCESVTVPSIHADRLAHGRAVRSLPAGLDQTEPQMLYPDYPQPYGCG